MHVAQLASINVNLMSILTMLLSIGSLWLVRSAVCNSYDRQSVTRAIGSLWLIRSAVCEFCNKAFFTIWTSICVYMCVHVCVNCKRGGCARSTDVIEQQNLPVDVDTSLIYVCRMVQKCCVFKSVKYLRLYRRVWYDCSLGESRLYKSLTHQDSVK